MEELGVYDGEIDSGDPRWSIPLGSHVHAFLIREKMEKQSVILLFFLSEKHTAEGAPSVATLT